MPEPVTMTTILGGAAVNIVCGLATNCMEPQRKALWDRVGNWWSKGKTQENHDALKATHAAYVAAMAKMAQAAAAIAFTDAERAAANALAALVAKRTFADFRWDAEHLPLDDCQARIETLFAGRHMPGAEDEGWRAYNRLIVADLAAWGVDLPTALETLFVEGHEPHAPWYVTFRHEFAEQMKADEKNPEGQRAFRILTFERLNELTANGAVLVEGVAALAVAVADVKEDTAAIRSDVAQILAALNAQPAEAERLRAEVAAIHQVRPDIDGASLVDLLRQREAERLAQADQLAAMPITDNLVRQHQNAAAEALRDNDDAGAIAALASAEAELAQRREADTRLQADLASQRAAALLRQLDWQAADSAWAEAAAMLAPFDVAAAEEIIWRAASALQAHGDRYGIIPALAIGASRWSQLLKSAVQAHDAHRIGRLSNNLGNALSVHGERIGGEESQALLAEAVVAYRVALEIRTRDATPEGWAMTQNNLAATLKAQGERCFGEESHALLQESVNAYREVLEVCSKDSGPDMWALTQNNLGTALQLQAERRGGDGGHLLFEEAQAAYRAALEVRTRDSAPMAWAKTYDNLAGVLALQGARSDGEAGQLLLTQAIAARRAALKICTRDGDPVAWAMMQFNLGVALKWQSERRDDETGAVLLAEAMAAYRHALEIYTPEAAPVDWAAVQNNLGNALRVQGERSGGEAGLALLAEAVYTYRAALEVRARGAATADWAMTQENIAIALLSMSRRSVANEARDHALAARDACLAALTVYSPEHMGHYHAKATRLLADIDARLSELSDGDS